MTNPPDFQDFTQVVSRLMQPLVGSPVVSAASGQHTQSLAVDAWAHSINLLITNAGKVISLSVTGDVTGFVYLNAAPVYDGGLYYLPIMSAIDTSVTIAWYQVDATSVSIHSVESDEPISVSVFNPISPSQAYSERLAPGFPHLCPASSQSTFNFAIDAITSAVRCSPDNPANLVWGRVLGAQSGKLYFDGSATNTPFPVTPIPVDHTLDTTVTVTLLTNAGGSLNIYTSIINAPDSVGSIPLTHPMSSNEMVPQVAQNDTPNQLPATFDGTIIASGTQGLVAPVTGVQYRLHQLLFILYSATTTQIELQDSAGNVFFHFHSGVAANTLLVPLLGQPCGRGAGINLKNLQAALSGSLAVTLWYSVL